MPLALLDDGGDMCLGTPIPPPIPPGLLITASEELIGINGVVGERCSWKYPGTEGGMNGLEDGVDGNGNPLAWFGFSSREGQCAAGE